MKKVLLLVFVVCFFVGSVKATTYYSQSSAGTVVGSFNSNRAGGGSTPANFSTSGDIFIIQGTGNGGTTPHTLTSGSTVTFGAGVTLEVEAGATLVENSNITFNATATFKLDASSFFTQNSSSAAGISAGIESWNSSATITYTNTGYISTANITGGAHPNVIVNTGGNANFAGVITNIAGNLTMSQGSSSLTLTGATAMTMTISGNLILSTGTTFSLGNGTATPIVNLGGNLSIASGITFTYNGSGAQGTLNFTKSGTQTFSKAGTMAATPVNFTVNSGSTLDVGTSVISGTGTFTVASGGGIITANTAGLSTTAATGSVQVTGTKTYNTGGNYTFNGSGAQATGNGITGANNLTINNSSGVTLTSATSISGTLTLTSGAFTNSSNLSMASASNISRADGTLGTAPTFTGSNVNITYTGSTSDITTGNEMPASGTTTLKTLTINEATNSVILGANVDVNTSLALTAGVIVSNGNSITLKGSSSTITGSTSFGTAYTSFVATCNNSNTPSSAGGLVIENIGTSGRTGDVLFPVGPTKTSYNPVVVNNSSANVSYTARVNTTAISGITPSSVNVQRTWNVSSASGSPSAVLKMQWLTADEGGTFSRASSKVVHYNGSTADVLSTGTAASGSNPWNVSSGSTSFTGYGEFGITSGTAGPTPDATQSTLTPTSASITANGSSTQVLTVQAKDAGGTNITVGAATVTITKQSGTGTIGSVTDNGDGTYTATVTSPTSTANGVFVATLGGSAVKSGTGSQTTSTITYTPGAANAVHSTLTPTSASITADGSSTQVFTVQAKDVNDNSLTAGGATVTITKQSGTGTIGSVTDNGNGTYTATVTSPTSTGSGVFVATLGGSAVQSGGGSQTTSTITYTPGTANAVHSTLTPTSASITANGSSTQVLTVQAKDVNDNNLTAGGATVTITKQSGTGTIGSVTDNGNGTYTATVTSPTSTGSGVFVATLGGSAVQSGGGSQTTATITYTPGTANAVHSTLTPTSASITADGSSTQILTVQAKDVNDNNLTAGGSTVTITKQSGSGTIGSVTDNGNGTYTATVTSPTATGSGVFVATLGGSAVQSGGGSQTTATITYIPGAADATQSTLTPTSATIAADGVATQVLTVQAKDANGNNLTTGGSTVTITQQSGTGSIGSVTDVGNGTYTATVLSAASNGSGVFVATLGGSDVKSGGGSQTTATITYSSNPPDAVQSTLTPTSASIAADGSSTQVLTVQAKDAGGTDITVGGATVTITKQSGTGSIGSVTDNGDGTYTATVTSPILTGSGVFVATLGGSAVQNGGGSQTTATITYTAGTANAVHSTLTPTSASITADGSSTQVLTVQAKDVNDNNLTAGGATVTIIQQSGTGTIGSVTDNGNGTYTATVTSPTATGSGVFVATLGGSPVKSGTGSQTTSTITYVVGAANAVHSTLTPTSASIIADGSSTQVLTVQAKDVNDNSLTTGGATVTITKQSGTGTIGSVTDNGNGTYTATVTSPTATGSGVFVATLGGSAVKSGTGSQTTATITYTPGTANAVHSTLTPTSASITADGSSTQVLTVQAKDVNDNNLTAGGATVTITKQSGTGTIGSVTDNGNGTYTATVTSPTATGSGVFVATLGGSPVKSGTGSQTTATITYIPGAANAVQSTLTPTSASIVADGIATQVLTVQAKDANGNTITSGGETVTITQQSGTGTIGSVIDNGNGTYTATVTSAASAGSGVFVATLGGSAVQSGGGSQTTATITYTATTSITDQFRSRTTGPWATASTWESFSGGSWITATLAPTSSAASITVLNTHTVTVGAAATAKLLTINTGGQVTISASQTLTVSDDGTGATDLSVVGYLKNSGTLTLSGTMSVDGTYEHNINGGAFPTATWNTNSTLLVTGITSTGPTGGTSQNFYNFTWNCPSQSTNISLAMNNNTIAGDLTLTSSGGAANAVRLTTAATATTNNITINGNIVVSAGILTSHGSSSGTSTITVTVGGNISINGGTLDLNAGSSGTATSTWNLTGNLSVTGILKGTNNTPTLHFSKGSGTQTFTNSAGTLTSGTLVVDAGSNLDAGTSIINGAVPFTLISGSTLTSASTTSFLTTSGTKTLSPTANYVFNGSSAQTIPASITAANNFTVNNSAGVTLAASVAISGALNMTSGKLAIGAFTLSINGTQNTTSGNCLTGSASSSLSTTGTGDLGTLFFDQTSSTTRTVSAFTANRTSSGNVTIGNAFIVTTLNLTAGTVTNSTNLTVATAGTITRNAGSLTVAPTFAGTVSVTYNNSGTLNTSVELPATVTTLSTAGGSATVSITSNTSISTSVVVSGGDLTINSGTTITFSGTASCSVSANKTFTVSGKISNSSSGTFTTTALVSTGLLNFASGGTYEHNFTTTQGVIPTASWNNSSTLSVIGYTSAVTLTSGGGWGQSFGHVTWNCSNQAAIVINLLGLLTTVNGDFTITSTGTSGKLRYNTNSPASPTLTISGNFNQASGTTFDMNNGTSTPTFNLAGNFNQSGGTIEKGGSGTITFNFNRTSGTQTFTQSGSVTAPIVWNVGTGSTSNIVQLATNFPLSTGSTITVKNGSALDCVTSVVSSGTSVTVNSGGTLKVGSTSGSGAVAANVTTSTLTLSSGSTVEFNGSGAQTAAARTFGDLKINNSNGVTLLGTATVDNLALTSGTLAVASQTLNINSAVTVGSGSLSSNANGTVNYAQGTTGQAVIAANYGNLTFSNVNKTLASSGTIGIAGTFTPGSGTTVVTGSTIDFNGSAQSIPAFTFNNLTTSGSATKSIAGAITVSGALKLATTSDKLSIGSNTLTLNGTMDAASAGYITGSSTSDISIGGTGPFGTLLFDPATPDVTNMVNNLTINRGSSGTVTLGNALRLSNVLTPTAGVLASAGYLTLASTASNTARIAPGSSSGGYITGSVTVERYLSASGDRAYRLLTPSVNASTSINANWQEGKQNPDVANNVVSDKAGYGTHITGSTAYAGGFDPTQNNQASLYIYNPAGPSWDAVTSTTSGFGATMSANTGYMLYVRGNRDNINVLQSSTPSSNTTLRATGTLPQGDLSFTGLASNTAFSLVTNPYASPVSWTSIYATGTNNTKFENYATLWDPNIGPRGGFITVDNTGLTAGGTTNITTQIQSGEAFFVQTKATVTTPTLDLLETNKSTDNSLNVFRNGTQTEMLKTFLFYTNATGRHSADGVTSLFKNGYSAAVDGDDAKQIDNWDEDVSIGRDGKSLSIERRPLVDANDTIPLTIARLKVQAYEWEFQPSNFNAPDLQAYLMDSYNSTETAISLTGTTVVPFTVTANAASSAANRFSIIFKPISITNWTGANGTDFADASNWDNGLPSTTKNAMVPQVANLPILASTQTINSITLATAADITIATDLNIRGNLVNNGNIKGTGTLVLSGPRAQTVTGKGSIGNLSINNSNGVSIEAGTSNMQEITGTLVLADGMLSTNGNLTLKSTSISNTATIAAIDGTINKGSISGKVTVERYIPAGKRGFRFITPGVSSTAPIKANWQEAATSATDDPRPGYGTHITGSIIDQANGFDGTPTGAPSLFQFDNTAQTWNSGIANTDNTPLSAGGAYRLFIRGNRSYNLTGAALATNTATTLRTTGTLVTGQVKLNSTTVGATPNMPTLSAAAEGYSFVGNPYVAPIDWSLLSRTDITGYYYIWDPTLGTRGAFVSCFTDGTKSNPSSSVTKDIQPGQAFFVQNNASLTSGPALTIEETHKTGTLTNVFRTESTPAFISMQLFIAGSTVSQDGAVALFASSYSNTVNNDDATKMPNLDENMAIERNNKAMSIERRAMPLLNDTVSLKLWQLANRDYTLKLDVANFTDPSLTAFVQDSYLNTETALDLAGTTSIAFTASSSIPASMATGRFRIVFRASGALPVTFTAVRAYRKGQGIQVEWDTQNEVNMDRYEVEKSIDGAQFMKLGPVTATGNTSNNYNWFDAAPASGSNYYRIRSLEKSGRAAYSQTVKVDMGKAATGINAYPNPITGNSFQLQMNNLPKGNYTIRITNTGGQEVFSKAIEHRGGSANQRMELDHETGMGAYQLELVGNGTRLLLKLMKQ